MKINNTLYNLLVSIAISIGISVVVTILVNLLFRKETALFDWKTFFFFAFFGTFIPFRRKDR
jgi:hypothetical protein